MLVHTLIQSGSSRSTFGILLSLVVGLTGAIATFAIIVDLGTLDSSARTQVDLSSGAVNRTLKGDRFPQTLAFHPNVASLPLTPRKTAFDSKLPDGCESLVSQLVNFQLARIAGRCVS